MLYRGIVQRGERRGEKLGFPTANIPLDGETSGIFVALARMDGKEYHAAVYADQKRKLLEAHLGKFEGGDLYGKEIEVELLKKIREDEKFEDVEILKKQIQKDVQDVVAYFKSL